MFKFNCLIVFLFVLVCVSFVGATSISNYSVPSVVPMGNSVTAFGVWSGGAGTWCNFFILDANTRVLVYRATDQLTSGSGRFSMNPKVITEPVFKRYSSYTLQTICADAVSDANFYVGQIESINSSAKANFEYLTNPENTDTFFIWGSMIGLFVLLLMFLFGIMRIGGR
jgi:hypothetical protein